MFGDREGASVADRTPSGRVRARGLGLAFRGDPGPSNQIVDVDGVEVGLLTLIEGDGPLEVGRGPVRTGATAVLPRGRGDMAPCAAGMHTLNGNGELTGSHWVAEIGTVATPIVLSNTHAVGPCHRGVVDWMVRRHPQVAANWVIPIVGETADGYLNDIDGNHVDSESVVRLLDDARTDPFELGSVGGGTGMNAYQYKAGTGTASRVVAVAGETYVLGVLVQANFGRRAELTICGVPVGERQAADNPMAAARARPAGAGSVIVLVATDAPLSAAQCTALARRVPLGLARTGATGSHFSGDIFLAFSTANRGAGESEPPDPPDGATEQVETVRWGLIDPLFAATVYAVEEAVVDSMVCAEEMIGRDSHRSPGLPVDDVIAMLSAAGRIRSPAEPHVGTPPSVDLM